jgi:molybdate transport system substrate-binding protein
MKSIAIVAAALLSACDSKATPPKPAVRVYAATSLKEVATDIAAEWSKRTGRPAQFQFEATSTLARQIQEGAPAEIWITAAPEWLDKVTVGDRYDWLSNTLVCVVPRDTKEFDLKTLDSLALGNDQVPVGKYARAALSHLGIRIPERTIYGQNVRDVLSKVSQGGAKAGIVYATDAAIDPTVRIAFTFPPESHPKILYSVGLLKPEGKELFDALREPWAKDMAKKRGFADVK